MKRLLLLVLAGSLIGGSGRAQSAEANLKKIAWLLGSWTRVQAKAGISGTERWEDLSPGVWRGTGITRRGTDTIEMEKLQLLVKGGDLYYLADVRGNEAAVYFKVTVIDDRGFICENPDHDFPKRIAYIFDGKTLKATISGEGRSIDFFFRKEE